MFSAKKPRAYVDAYLELYKRDPDFVEEGVNLQSIEDMLAGRPFKLIFYAFS